MYNIPSRSNRVKVGSGMMKYKSENVYSSCWNTQSTENASVQVVFMENPKLKFINIIKSAQTGNVTRHCKAPETTEFPLEFPADGKEPMHATAITINGPRYMDSIGKFQLSEIKFGFCFLFSAVINFVSTFKRLDHCVKVWSTQRHLKFMKSAVNLEVKTGTMRQ